eukprot:COSAG04_NODE_32453_length_251_cov_0.657895_1_plen_61_part_10
MNIWERKRSGTVGVLVPCRRRQLCGALDRGRAGPALVRQRGVSRLRDRRRLGRLRRPLRLL